jgi:acyl carrier protein
MAIETARKGAGMAGTQTIEERIQQFVLKQFPLARKNGLKPGDKWLENGLVDSLGILDLVQYLEQEFSIQAADDELLPENFESLSAVVEFTRKKMSVLAPTKEEHCK